MKVGEEKKKKKKKTKKKSHGDNNSNKVVDEVTTTPTTMITVIAPAALQAGSTFDAEVDGKTFTVTVPEGGVGEGDDFEVPYPTITPIVVVAATATPVGVAVPVAAVAVAEEPTIATNTHLNEVQAFVVPTGHWRYDLFDCFSSCCCPCLMGWCCYPILMGQVMQRMKFNFFGCPNVSGNGQPPICLTYTIITVVLFVFGAIIWGATQTFGYIIWIIWCVYMLVVFTCTRNTMRKKYNIPPICCCGDNELDDCCSVYWCACCTAIQLARHTHDNQLYEYDMLSKTGLPQNAPEIV
mmetsp:Transcript_10498/g.11801  ORF Transcript_10498/g.11801 Transcript_10498/m.11801 type:complete len:295 (+) Transcript_10498:1-885(+)